MKHLFYVLWYAARRPRLALLGAREFRSAFTTHFNDAEKLESYDSGRELAHMVTLRRYEP